MHQDLDLELDLELNLDVDLELDLDLEMDIGKILIPLFAKMQNHTIYQ